MKLLGTYKQNVIFSAIKWTPCIGTYIVCCKKRTKDIVFQKENFNLYILHIRRQNSHWCRLRIKIK